MNGLLGRLPQKRRTLWICLGLYLFAQLVFLINIQFPRTPNFDEYHYVPSAKQMLALTENQNYEHPPFGKAIMAIGIGLFGDRPIGWRIMSTVFGALTLVGMYFWAFAIFEDESIALWAAFLTFFNQLLFVQARIGMLDTFMMAFLTWAMAAFSATWLTRVSPRDLRRLFLATGALLGFATACKWFGIIAWAMCVGLIFLVKVLQDWRARFEDEQDTDWYRPDLWTGMRPIDWVLSLAVVPFVCYFVTFIPLFLSHAARTSPLDFFYMQWRMWDGQSRVVSSHPYMSTWKDWALLKRPIWYAFDKEGPQSQWVRGVLLIGNPLVMWTGIVALFACAWGWLVERRRDAFLILIVFLAFYFSWAVIPRKVAFYYYYYPAGMVLSLALAYVFKVQGGIFARPWARWAFLGLAAAMFFYFFPILAALRIPADSFRGWMWFNSWI